VKGGQEELGFRFRFRVRFSVESSERRTRVFVDERSLYLKGDNL
jgi:hypothetical protein